MQKLFDVSQPNLELLEDFIQDLVLAQPDPYQLMVQLAQKNKVISKGGKEIELRGRDEDQEEDPFKTNDQEGDSFGAVKPWKGALVKPTEARPMIDSLPSISLQIEFVNGLNACELSQMVHYTSQESKIVYPAALLGIVLDTQTLEQKYLGGGLYSHAANFHTDDIVSLDYNAACDLVASGSLGKNPQVCVWTASTQELVVKFKQGVDTRAAAHVRLSQDGSMVFTADRSEKPVVRVFNSKSGKLITSQVVGQTILTMSVSHDNKVAVAGPRACTVFAYNQGSHSFKKLSRTEGLFSALAWSGDRLITGKSNGLVSDGKHEGHHKSMVSAITVRGEYIYTSSHDNTLVVRGQDLQPVYEIATQSPASSIDARGDRVLLCLKNGKIIEHDGPGSQPKVLINGHFAGEVWGLAHDGQGHVISAADDNKVLVFDVAQRKVINEIVVNEKNVKGLTKASTLSPFAESKQCRAVAYNEVRGSFAVATNHGQVQYFQSIGAKEATWKKLFSKDWCEVLRFSPDGNLLAAGFHSRQIIVYDLNTNKAKLKLSGHSSFITGLDWSMDSEYLRSVSGAYELLYWSISKKKQQTHSVKTEWASQSRFDFYTENLWAQIVDGSFVNWLDRSKDGQWIAVGEDDSNVRVYRYPVGLRKCKKFRGHSSHVVRVAWGEGDKRVYSVGGNDKTMIVWRVTEG